MPPTPPKTTVNVIAGFAALALLLLSPVLTTQTKTINLIYGWHSYTDVIDN